MEKLIRWLANSKMLAAPREIFKKFVVRGVTSKNGVILYYDDQERDSVINLIKTIKQDTELLLGISEAYQIYMAVKRSEKIEGDIAEVGVYKGGSAKIICEAKGNKKLHLFDTFEGIPSVEAIDSATSTKDNIPPCLTR